MVESGKKKVLHKAAPVSSRVVVPSVVPAASVAGAAPAGKGKTKKNPALLWAIVAVILVLVVVFALFFVLPKYKYSFNINGMDFVSNESTPSVFFPQFKDNNSFVVSVRLKDGESNAWVVNAMNLWIVALNADHKRVTTLVETLDSSGNFKECMTNDANVLSARPLSQGECSALLASTDSAQVVIALGNDNTVLFGGKTVTVIASGTKTIGPANYYVIKQMYPDFDKTLAIVNERINSVS